MKNQFIGLMAADNKFLVEGLFAIFKSKNTFVPVNPAFPRNRVHFVLNDCNIHLLVTDEVNYPQALQIAQESPVIYHLLCFNNISGQLMAKHYFKKPDMGIKTDLKTESQGKFDRFCYVIYTSGSTGKPKGVPITHRNLNPLLFYSREFLNLDTNTRVMKNLSYTFDFGIFEILSTILFGGRLYVLNEPSNFSFFADFINKQQINTLHTTPAFLNNLADIGQKIPAVTCIHLGGEPLTGKIVRNAKGIISPKCILYNGYGPTEASINCTFFSLTFDQLENVKENIPIGQPCDRQEIFILDKFLHPQPFQVAGELCIAGPGLSAGYLNRPELTREKFIDFYHAKIYCTGDLALWSTDGNIEFLGRIDQQVKVRGFRIELGEIESCLSLCPMIKDNVVIIRDHSDGNPYLCAYIVFQPGKSLSIQQLREFLLKHLPGYMIPAYFIELEKIPISLNGKIDRKALPKPGESFIDTGVPYAAPFTNVEKKLVHYWQQLLRLKKIGIYDDFFQVGGDSIMVNRCIAFIRHEFRVEMPLRKFFERPFVKALAEDIEKQKPGLFTIKPAARTGEIPLSFAQERLWFLQELDAANVAYFVPRLIHMKGKLDVTILERTFSEIIRRHEILRTVFPNVNGQPVQRILPPFQFKIPVLDWSRLEKVTQEFMTTQFLNTESRKSFDFEKGPLLRAAVLKFKEEEYLFVLTEHHLIHDGWTQGVLLKEFISIFSAYRENKNHNLPGPAIQYADYAIWERSYLQGEYLQRHLHYWEQKLWGLIPVLELPVDRPRPAVISGQGALREFRIAAPLTTQLIEFSRRNGVTLFVTMLSIFNALLYRYTGSNDICTGTGIANRGYKEMENMLGMVINSLPLRTHPSGDMPFKFYLSQVMETCLEAYQYQDTPFGKIVEMLAQERSLSYSPIFQVMFSFMDTPTETLWLPGLDLQLKTTHNRSAKFDIDLVVVPPQMYERNEWLVQSNEEILVEWEYNIDIFDNDTMERMIRHYIRLLAEAIHHPEVPIACLSMLENDELKSLLWDWNNTDGDFPREKTVPGLFEEQAEKLPDHMAISFAYLSRSKAVQSSSLTYRLLNGQAGQLAGFLLEKGVQPDTIVGILMERSLEMITGILGILKSGSAYLPIDPGYPDERMTYMLKDCRAKLLLGDDGLKGGKAVSWDGMKVRIEPIIHPQNHLAGHHSSIFIHHSNLSYVIYTSGSTGKPKGVLITQDSFIDFTTWAVLEFEHCIGYRVLLSNSYASDGSIQQIFPPLISGGILHIIEKELRLDVSYYLDYLRTYRINNIDEVPVLMSELLAQIDPADDKERLPDLTCLSLGSEYVPIDLIRRCRRYLNHNGRIINAYGPAETSVEASTYHYNQAPESDCGISLIGKPRRNLQVYILDEMEICCPIGVRGEIHIGGTGLARGYLNHPGLTAEKFRPLIKNKSFFGGLRGAAFSKKAPLIYKTGDLARWLINGNIEFLGRIDHQVKIRGFRIEPAEIENTLMNHPQVKKSVVLIQGEEKNDKYLCAYVVLSGSEDVLAELREYTAKTLPDYMIPSYFIQLEKIPLTPNGKIDRAALLKTDLKTNENYIPPGNEIETKLVCIFSEVLSRGESHSSSLQTAIGIDHNFFQLGGHSLKAAVLVSRIEKTFNIRIPLSEIFKNPRIRELAGYIKNAVHCKYKNIDPVEKKEYYTLSSAQKRLYFLQQMKKNSTAYNIPLGIIMEGDLNLDKLEQAIIKLIDRHESLRTSIEEIHGEPVQRIHEHMAFKLSAAVDKPFLAKNFIRPFDLSQAPLLRIGLIKLAPGKYIFLVDMHHIAADGISIQVLVQDFSDFYAGKELPGIRLQYKDYAEWQNREKLNAKIPSPAEFWKKEYQGDIPVLELPTDYARPAVQGFEGDRIHFELDCKNSEALKELALKTGTTLYAVLLSLYTILLGKLSGQEDIVVGTPAAGRSHAGLEKIIGMFINTLALRNYPGGEKGFADYLVEVKEKTLKALENQDYPYEDLVEKVVLIKDLSRNPLFDTMFMLENTGFQKIVIPGLMLNPYEYENKTAKFDLSLNAAEIDGYLAFTFIYSTNLFRRLSIERLVDYWKNIVNNIIVNPYVKISEVELLSEEARKKLVNDFNENLAETFEIPTIQSRLTSSFLKYRENTAVVYGAVHITYLELEHRAACVSQWLANRNTPRNSFTGIYTENKITIISFIIGILQHGCLFVPLDTSLPLRQISRMIRQANISVILTDAHHEPILNGINEKRPECMQIFALNDSFYRRELVRNNNGGTTYDPEDKIYIYFTSGSTGLPNAIVGKNKSLVQFLQWEIDTFGINENSCISQLTAVGFDAFLRDIFVPLLAGGVICIPYNKEILMDADALGNWLEKNRVNLVHCVPSLFRIILAGSLTSTSFPGLSYILLSGEPVNPNELQDWFRIFGRRIQLVNFYGPTETTMIKTYHFISKDDAEAGKIPAGRPIPGTRVIILDKYLKICPKGIRGEIYIRTPYSTYGYLDNPGLNALRFIKNPFPARQTDFIYQTGDVGRVLENGEIEILGRMDRQVKIRGIRVELENIENCLLKLNKIKQALVISLKRNDDANYLGAFIVLKKEIAFEKESTGEICAKEFREHLAKELPGYMVPSNFTVLEHFPLTANGKIDLKALMDYEIKNQGKQECTAPRNVIEVKLVKYWKEILGISKDTIGIDSNFFESGGHSLKVMSLVSMIHRELNVKIPLLEIFKSPTVRGLAEYIQMAAGDINSPIEPVEAKEYYVLSSAQKRLFFLQQLDKTSTAYNMFSAWILEGTLNINRLEQTIKNLIRRHEGLRTSVIIVDEEPVQRIYRNLTIEIKAIRLSSSGDTDNEIKGQIIMNFIQAFDLAAAPLFRVGLIEINKNRHLFMVDMHHIISDGISSQVLAHDFSSLYAGKELTCIKLQYKDYAEWQAGEKLSSRIKEQCEYWKKEFAGEIPVLELPTDYVRSSFQVFDGGELNFVISSEMTGIIKTLAQETGTTLYMVLLAVYVILLSRLTGQEDIVIGTPTAGRRHTDLEKIIGMFVNTLALRNYPAGEKQFSMLLEEVRETTLEAFENQEFQYEDLIEQISIPKDAGRNPLFDTMFVLQNTGFQEIEIPGLKLKPYHCENKTSKFDLSLIAVELEGKLVFSLSYCTKLFKRETIIQFTGYFKNAVESIIANKNGKISRIEIITEADKQKILQDFNDTDREYPGDKTICDFFEEQVDSMPDNIALVGNEGNIVRLRQGKEALKLEIHISYRELGKGAGKLAGLLISEGVTQDTIVGIMAERSILMITGIFGILKSGGGYLPIDPDYPEERIIYMLRDSGTKLLAVVNDKESEKVRSWKGRNVLLEEIFNSQKISSSLLPLPVSYSFNSLNIAYVIYTSGTTGKPKGTVIEHHSLVNRLTWMQREYPLHADDTVLQKTMFTFDVSVWEIFWWSMSGARLCLLQPRGEKDPGLITKIIARNRITVVHFVPAMLRIFLDYWTGNDQVRGLTGLKYVIASGEALLKDDVKRFKGIFKKFNGMILANLYGPTEATIDVSYYNCLEAKPVDISLNYIPIGKPIDNTRLCIFNKYMQIQPVGIPGELCIAGAGLARGYLNQPGLTAEKFRPLIKNKSFFRGLRGAVFSKKAPLIYKTGDLARWLSDGNIEFLGRMDHQVKIRGYRIELEEIEIQLINHPWVKEATIISRDKSGDITLFAYIVLDNTRFPALVPSPCDHLFQEAAVNELKIHLGKRLPGYMVPTYFIILDKLPLSPNGKIDRKILTDSAKGTSGIKGEYMGPRDEIEKGMVYIAADILGIEPARISIRANFFNMGFNSITVLKFAQRISGEFKIDFPMGTLFTGPSIEEAAANIKKGYQPNASMRAVLLNRKKANRNLFLISGDGGIYIFKELALLLEGKFNVYGMLGKGFMDMSNLPGTRQEIYEDFINEMKLVQAEGPYLIGGYCFGAIIAYEMTRILEDQENEISKLIFFDYHAIMRDYIIDYIVLFRWFNKCRRGIEIIKDKVWSKVRSFKMKLGPDRRNGNHNKNDNGKPSTAMDLETRRLEIAQNYRRIINKLWIYSRIIRTPLLVVKAEGSEFDPDPRWNPGTIARTSKKGVEQIKTPGNHFNMFEFPHVPVLSKLLIEKI